MKYNRTRIFFFSVGLVVAELYPFFDIFRLSHCKPMEPCEQNISSKKISNDQELLQSDPTSQPLKKKGNN